MNFIKKIIRRIIERDFKKKIDRASKFRINKFHYIKKNQNIGIIIDASSDETLRFSKDFISYLNGYNSQIKELFFVQKKVGKNETLPENTISIYPNNWNKAELIENFFEYEFDILFVLGFSEMFELHYLTGFANADFKVSPQYDKFNYADLTFIIDENPKPEKFFDAVKKYLIET